MLLELHRGKDALTPNELVCLFVSLPPLRKQETDLYRALARQLAAVVDELTLEECLQVAAACSAAAPAALLERLLAALLPAVPHLTPAQLVTEVLDPLSAAPAPVEAALEQLYDAALPSVLRGLEELEEGMELAILYTILRSKPAYCSPDAERRVLDAFVARREHSCARSTAMVFTAVAEAPHGMLLHFARAMAQRVLFLSTDFTTEEFMDVFQVYVASYTSMLALKESMQPAPGDAEWQLALQQEAALLRTVAALSEQLMLLLESASAYLSRPQLMELLQVYVRVAEDLGALPAASPGPEAERAERERMTRLFLTKLPQTRAIMRAVSAKCITELPRLSLKELLTLLQAADVLGPAFVQDAAVGGALRELTRRQMQLGSQEVERVSTFLLSLQGLRSGQQRTINETVLPQLYKRFSA
ncbi:hypothetical protein STCU_07792 [Strigomonas culicis]|uniref:Uncharacterized protein n=1 Tax=Strigomonas culicis TaxID=28005 RepID=S9V8F9_9TRYP|nr:hypothetical protein STCU_07792 [Strigomonas culicis]|eukprot:EPY23261.1 hypothetical protein STCU_07792 [Strigomonas culicis]